MLTRPQHGMRLSYRDQTADIDPMGGRIVSYKVSGIPVLTPLGLPAAAYPSAVLAPWPNRVAQGRWNWEGEELQLPVNEQPLDTAIHGLVDSASFTTSHLDAASVRLSHDLPPSAGYPFELRIETSYALREDGLICGLSATNTGARAAPVALGVHPYLDTRGPVDRVRLSLPAARTIAVDRQWQETGRPGVEGTPWDLRRGKPIGSAVLDSTWTELDRPAGRVQCRLKLPSGDAVTLWSGATCRYVVVFSGDTLPAPFTRQALAVEPCTAPANALRSGADLDLLAPGDTLRLDWGLSASW